MHAIEHGYGTGYRGASYGYRGGYGYGRMGVGLSFGPGYGYGYGPYYGPSYYGPAYYGPAYYPPYPYYPRGYGYRTSYMVPGPRMGVVIGGRRGYR